MALLKASQIHKPFQLSKSLCFSLVNGFSILLFCFWSISFSFSLTGCFWLAACGWLLAADDCLQLKDLQPHPDHFEDGLGGMDGFHLCGVAAASAKFPPPLSFYFFKVFTLGEGMLWFCELLVVFLVIFGLNSLGLQRGFFFHLF